MLRDFSVLPGISSSQSDDTRRECAWPRVCDPVMAVNPAAPPHLHSLKNGICVVMSFTDCPKAAL